MISFIAKPPGNLGSPIFPTSYHNRIYFQEKLVAAENGFRKEVDLPVYLASPRGSAK